MLDSNSKDVSKQLEMMKLLARQCSLMPFLKNGSLTK